MHNPLRGFRKGPQLYKPSAWLLGLWASLFSGILVEASVTSLYCACLQSQPTVMTPSPAASLGSEWLRPPCTAATAAFSRWPFANRTLVRKFLLVNLQFRTLEWGLTSWSRSHHFLLAVRLFFNGVNLFKKYGHFLCTFKCAPLMCAQIACIQILLLCSLLPVFTVRLANGS